MLSSYWLAHFHLMKKSAKVQLYFGSGYGMMKSFTCCLSRIMEYGLVKKDYGLSTCKP